MIYKPTYIIQVGRIFYFQKRLQDKIFRKSLKTKDLLKARAISRSVMEKIDETLVSANILKAIVDDEIERVIEATTALLQPRSDAAKQAIQGHHHLRMATEFHNAKADEHNNYLREYNVTDREEMSYMPNVSFRDYQLRKLEQPLPSYYQINENDTGEELEYHTAGIEQDILKTHTQKIVAHVKNDDYADVRAVLNSLMQSFGLGLKREYKCPLWDTAVQEIINDKNSVLYFSQKKSDKGKNKHIGQKTVDELVRHLTGTLSHFFQDKHVDEITSMDCDRVFDICYNLPNAKFKPWKDMSIAERVEYALGDSVADDQKTTGNLIKIRTALNTVFEYYFKKYMLDYNPVDKMRFENFPDGGKRGDYSRSQVRTLVDFCTSKPLNQYTCAILLMAYAGLRNGEAVKITSDSVTKHQNGFVYFDVKGTKTDNAERLVPVHQKLIDFGVIEYLKKKTESITSQQLTMWFKRREEKLRLPSISEKNEMLSLYSLRHSFMTELTNTNCSGLRLEAIVGHAHKGTKNQYIGELDLTKLNDVLQKLSYDYD